MPRDLELYLDRIADVLKRGGMEPFFANPLLTPESKWFPDRWTPDLASVRRLLFRFADYAGLGNLDFEVGLIERERAPAWLPASLVTSRQDDGLAALYLGTQEGTAFFGFEVEAFSDPNQLLGILAHEMAHAWRDAKGLPGKDRRVEEQLTDLTTIVLGWGILTSNAAYQFHSSGQLYGPVARTTTEHRRTGYLPAGVMSAMVAVHAAVRGEDLRSVRRHLGATQADAFDQALEWIREIDLDARLGLPPEEERAFPDLESAPDLTLPLSRTGTALHEIVRRMVEEIGERGGFLQAPVPFPIESFEERHAELAHWGRADALGGWHRRLEVVSDPEWAVNALVLESVDGKTDSRVAIGHFPDAVCEKKRMLEHALESLFDSDSPHTAGLPASLFPAIPGFVFVPSAAVLGASELERLFRRAARRFDPAELSAETRWIASFETGVRERIAGENEGRPSLPGRATSKDPFGDWWRLVSDPRQSTAEWRMVESNS